MLGAVINCHCIVQRLNPALLFSSDVGARIPRPECDVAQPEKSIKSRVLRWGFERGMRAPTIDHADLRAIFWILSN
jgi:hypothetical protein